jgi:hypothetical protein
MNVLNWFDRQSPLTGIAIVVGIFACAALIAAAGRAAGPIAAQPLPPILILSTPVPTVLPTADTTIAAEIAALRARVAALEAERGAPVEQQPVETQHLASVQNAPEPTTAGPGYTAHTDQGPIFVPDNATPVPAGAVYTGPFLAPNATEAPSGPRLCTGFGDWRDYGAMYASSPICHQEAP